MPNDNQFPHIKAAQAADAAAAAQAAPADPPAPVTDPGAQAAPAPAPAQPAQPTPAPATQESTPAPAPAASAPSADGKPAAEPAPSDPQPSPFANFWGDSEAKALEALPEGARAYLAKRLKLDPATDPGKLAETLTTRLTKAEELEAQASTPVFANEDLARLNELARGGADWRAHVQADAQLSQLESQVKAWREGTNPRQWLEWALTNQAKQMGFNEAHFVRNNLDGLTEEQIAAQGDQVRQKQIEAVEQQINTLRDEQTKRQDSAKQAQAAWKTSVQQAAQQYRDPDVGQLRDSEAQSIAQALGSEMVEVRLPKKFYDEVLAGADGNLDPQKAVKTLAELRLGPQKVKHLMTATRSETRRQEFLKQTNADPNNPANPAPANPQDTPPPSATQAYMDSLKERNRKKLGTTQPTQ